MVHRQCDLRCHESADSVRRDRGGRGEIEGEGGAEGTTGPCRDETVPALGERENGVETALRDYAVFFRIGKARLAGSRYPTVRGGSLNPSPSRPLGGETAFGGSTPQKASAGVMPWSP